MKVLIFNSLYSPNIAGGAERSVQLTAEALKSLGVEPVIVSTSDHDAVDHVNDIRVYYRKTPNLYWMLSAKEQSRLKKPFWHLLDARNLLASSGLTDVISRESPDVVHTNNLSGFSVRVWDVAGRLGVPIVHTIRDHYLLCLSTTMYRNDRRCDGQCFACRLLSRPKRDASVAVDAVVGISRSILDRHLEHGFFPQAGIKQCIYNPVAVAPHRKKRANDNHACVFGYAGLLESSKGIEFLLQRFRSLNLENASLHVYGRGVTAAFEESLIARYQCPAIQFMGFKRPEEIYPGLDVIVVPSLLEEAFGRTVAEANAYGIPAIVSNRGGLPEIVVEGVNGFVFDPDREGDLEDKLRLLAEDPGKVRRLSDKCRETAKNYKPSTIASEYLGIYRELTA